LCRHVHLLYGECRGRERPPGGGRLGYPRLGGGENLVQQAHGRRLEVRRLARRPALEAILGPLQVRSARVDDDVLDYVGDALEGGIGRIRGHAVGLDLPVVHAEDIVEEVVPATVAEAGLLVGLRGGEDHVDGDVRRGHDGREDGVHNLPEEGRTLVLVELRLRQLPEHAEVGLVPGADGAEGFDKVRDPLRVLAGVPDLDGLPGPVGLVQGEREGVVADSPDVAPEGGDGRLPVVPGAEEQVGVVRVFDLPDLDRVPTEIDDEDDLRAAEEGERRLPDLRSPEDLAGDVQQLDVLELPVLFGDDPRHEPVVAAADGLDAGDRDHGPVEVGHRGDRLHLPAEAREVEQFLDGHRLGGHLAQPVPRGEEGERGLRDSVPGDADLVRHYVLLLKGC
jgi:hypothetical protein